MRIAIITPGFLPVPDVKGGAVEMLTNYFVEENERKKRCIFDLYTITPEIDVSDLKETNIISININKFEEYIAKIVNYVYRKLNIQKHLNFYVKKAVKQLKKNRNIYDYILIENNMYAYEVIYKYFKDNTKFVFHLHNDIGGIDKPLQLCDLIAKTSFRTIAVSNYIKNRFEECTGGKANVLFNCIDEKELTVIDTEFLDKIRYKFNLDDSKITFIYVGRLQKEKGSLELVRAFSESALLKEKAQLLVVGSIWYGKKNKSEYYDEIQKYVNLSNNIHLTGKFEHSKISSLMELADVCVIPTICEEAFGMVALEAMVNKKALIISDSGGLPEVVDSSTPIVDRKNIVNLLKVAMEEYANKSKEELIELGKKQYDRYTDIDDFNNKEYLDRLLKILEE